MTAFSKEERQRAVDSVPYWFHSIDVGDGVVTPGAKSAEFSSNEWNYLRVPQLHGKSVLDIGAWDGRYSFAAEDAGAGSVVSLDHYSWSVDFPAYQRYVDECRAHGENVPDAMSVPHVWRPDQLPGKAGYDTARLLRSSNAKDVVLDFANDDLSTLGQFDVVLFVGVLYHLADQVDALRRVRSLTREVAIILTYGIRVGGFEDRPLAEFYPSDEFDGDPTNWWRPNMKALIGWCEAAGFSDVEVVLGPNEQVQLAAGEHDTFTAIIHAFP